jgi:hypothetical protein
MLTFIGEVFSLLILGLVPAVLLIGIVAGLLPALIIACKITENVRSTVAAVVHIDPRR